MAKRKLDPDVAERAILFGLTTAAYIARQIGWSARTFQKAVKLSWTYELVNLEAQKAAPSPAQDQETRRGGTR